MGSRCEGNNFTFTHPRRLAASAAAAVTDLASTRAPSRFVVVAAQSTAMLRRVFATQGVAPGRRRLATRQAILLRDFVLKGRTEPSGSVVTVSAGYLRNFMFPRQIAIPATRANLAAAAARADAAGPAEPAAAVEPPPDPRAQTIKPSARTLQRDSR